uniref:Hemimethylated DNA-binding domain-containing protein n=1 Tax=Lepeophtheirus salmonis TaxID=72036 RepID=A0A0K2THA2_LEPSM
MVNINSLRSAFKYIVIPALVLLGAQKVIQFQDRDYVGYLEDVLCSTHDKIAEISDWIDSFLPESLYNDVGLGDTFLGEENVRPLFFMPANENVSALSPGSYTSLTHFSSSMRPRRWRPSNILYRVGELIYHKSMDIYCVIVGWDKTAKAPSDWLDKVYKESKEEKIKEVHYMNVCGSEGKGESILMYLSQDEVSKIEEIPNNIKLKLTLLQSHFDIKSESEFQAMDPPYPLRPWLRKLYPMD